MTHRSDNHHHHEGVNALMGALVVMGMALALVMISGSFGHTRRISDLAPPSWPASSFR
jgi:hypothetical protein